VRWARAIAFGVAVAVGLRLAARTRASERVDVHPQTGPIETLDARSPHGSRLLALAHEALEAARA
jgi:hypothetical protein